MNYLGLYTGGHQLIAEQSIYTYQLVVKEEMYSMLENVYGCNKSKF